MEDEKKLRRNVLALCGDDKPYSSESDDVAIDMEVTKPRQKSLMKPTKALASLLEEEDDGMSEAESQMYECHPSVRVKTKPLHVTEESLELKVSCIHAIIHVSINIKLQF